MISDGAIAFVAGDDDQSIFSFRFAFPRGIQDLPANCLDSGDHALTQCFRCTTDVLDCPLAVIGAHPPQNRTPKQTVSVYAASDPPIQGNVARWIFNTGVQEATAIAESCASLINAGIPRSQIIVLLSDRHLLRAPIEAALEASGIPYDSRDVPEHLAEPWGRALFAMIRIAINNNDYVAHRTLFGLLPGVGITTCLSVGRKVSFGAGLNYRNVFYDAIPDGVFVAREIAAISRVAAICTEPRGVVERRDFGRSN